MKFFARHVDRIFGTILRSLVRNVLVNPLIRMNYRVTVVGDRDAISSTRGAIVTANHSSFIDGPFLMNECWPHGRLRPTVWHVEYTNWIQWPLMKLFGAVCLGSPKRLPDEERRRRKEGSIRIMKKILDAGHHLLIFAEGGINDGTRVSIPSHYSGVHDLIAAHPDRSVLFVRIIGLEHSTPGKRRGRTPSSPFRRLPVRVVITRVDNVSLEGGPQGLNARMERFWNDDVPIATYK